MLNFHTNLATIWYQNISKTISLTWIQSTKLTPDNARTEWGKKKIQHKALEIWEKLPVELKECSYFRFKKVFKQTILNGYNNEVKIQNLT